MAEQRVSDWKLERLVAGDLSDHEARDLMKQLADAGEQHRLAAVHYSNSEILDQHSPAIVASEIRRRHSHLRLTRSAFWLFLPTAGLMAAVLLLPRGTPYGEHFLEHDSTRTKGLAPHLLVYRRTGEAAETLAAGAVVHRGDLLQLRYVPAGRTFGVILSIDGRGTVTLHMPEHAEQAPILASEERLLGRAYELDDAPGFERFFLVTSTLQFEVPVVLAAARELARDPKAAPVDPLALPSFLQQTSLLLKKAKR
ncbi:MAG: ActD-like protein [Myxococcales bacterium]